MSRGSGRPSTSAGSHQVVSGIRQARTSESSRALALPPLITTATRLPASSSRLLQAPAKAAAPAPSTKFLVTVSSVACAARIWSSLTSTKSSRWRRRICSGSSKAVRVASPST